MTDGCAAIPACADGHIVYAWGTDPDSPGPFTDPDRSLETYMGTLGETPTLEAFLVEARAQSRSNWRPEFTAVEVNAYVREGFDVVPE